MGDDSGKLEWDDAYRTGIAVLDDQHLAIILLYNDVLRAIRSGASQCMVAETVDSLIFFVRQHFEWEGRFLAAAGCDRAAEHRAEHHHFDLVARVFYGCLGAADDGGSFAAFARGWIVGHIIRDVGFSPAAQPNLQDSFA
ncbi:MAG TPA: hemerythrin domain-containing protein [Azospirillum sp.]